LEFCDLPPTIFSDISDQKNTIFHQVNRSRDKRPVGAPRKHHTQGVFEVWETWGVWRGAFKHPSLGKKLKVPKTPLLAWKSRFSTLASFPPLRIPQRDKNSVLLVCAQISLWAIMPAHDAQAVLSVGAREAQKKRLQRGTPPFFETKNAQGHENTSAQLDVFEPGTLDSNF
jgi:hypothetical protein